jgi:hypothetical protein
MLPACSEAPQIDSDRIGFGLSHACSPSGGGNIQVVSPGSIDLLVNEQLFKIEVSHTTDSNDLAIYVSPVDPDNSSPAVAPGDLRSHEDLDGLYLVSESEMAEEQLIGPGLWSIVLVNRDPNASYVDVDAVTASLSDVQLVNDRTTFEWQLNVDCASSP